MSPSLSNPYSTSTAIISEPYGSNRDPIEIRPPHNELELREIATSFLSAQGARSKENPHGATNDPQREVQEFQRSLRIVTAFLSSSPQFTQALLDQNVELLYTFAEGQQSIAGMTLRDESSSSVLTIRTTGSVEFRSPESSFTANIDSLSAQQLTSIQSTGLAARLSAKAALVEIFLDSVREGRDNDLSQENQLSSELLIVSEYLIASSPSYRDGTSIPIEGPDGSIAYVARRSGRPGQAPETTLQLDNLVIQGRRDGTIQFFRAAGDTFTKAERLTPEELRLLRNFHTHQAPLIRLLQQGEAPTSI